MNLLLMANFANNFVNTLALYATGTCYVTAKLSYTVTCSRSLIARASEALIAVWTRKSKC